MTRGFFEFEEEGGNGKEEEKYGSLFQEIRKILENSRKDFEIKSENEIKEKVNELMTGRNLYKKLKGKEVFFLLEYLEARKLEIELLFSNLKETVSSCFGGIKRERIRSLLSFALSLICETEVNFSYGELSSYSINHFKNKLVFIKYFILLTRLFLILWDFDLSVQSLNFSVLSTLKTALMIIEEIEDKLKYYFIFDLQKELTKGVRKN